MLDRRVSLGVYFGPIEDAERAGHRIDRTPVETPDGKTSAEPEVATSIIPHGVETSDPHAAAAGSRAVWVRDSVRADEVLRIDLGERSYGVFVIATTAHRDGSGRRRRFLFLDCQGPVYLMSETGSTVDRFAVDD